MEVVGDAVSNRWNLRWGLSGCAVEEVEEGLAIGFGFHNGLGVVAVVGEEELLRFVRGGIEFLRVFEWNHNVVFSVHEKNRDAGGQRELDRE